MSTAGSMPPDADDTVDTLREAAATELERFRAKREGASLMPLNYALGALKKAAPPATKRPDGTGWDAAAVETLFNDIGDLIKASEKGDGERALDRGGQVLRTIKEIRSLLRPSPD